jgi:hypothetical protein
VIDDDRDRDRDVNGPAPRDDASPSALNSADPIRNFSLNVDERIRALTIGVPAWAARKRKIEDDQERFVAELVAVHDELVATKRTSEQIEIALFAAANALDLEKLNDVVRRHNRYYPVEANLPMDRQTGSYLVYGHIWVPEEPYTPARLVALARVAIERGDGADVNESEG